MLSIGHHRSRAHDIYNFFRPFVPSFARYFFCFFFVLLAFVCLFDVPSTAFAVAAAAFFPLPVRREANFTEHRTVNSIPKTPAHKVDTKYFDCIVVVESR